MLNGADPQHKIDDALVEAVRACLKAWEAGDVILITRIRSHVTVAEYAEIRRRIQEMLEEYALPADDGDGA